MQRAANSPTFPDPFGRERGFSSTFWNAILATALFRCWHILIFFAAWSTAISVISDKVKDLSIASTLLTVFVGYYLLFCFDTDVTSRLQHRYRSWFCNFLQDDVEL
jgi:putative membrane protein